MGRYLRRPRRQHPAADAASRLTFGCLRSRGSALLVPARVRRQLEPRRTGPVRGVPAVVEPSDVHASARLARMDEAAVADVDPVVAQTIEEHQIAGLEAV